METKDVVIDLAKVHSLQTPKHVAYIKMWASGEEQYVLFSFQYFDCVCTEELCWFAYAVHVRLKQTKRHVLLAYLWLVAAGTNGQCRSISE
jgi:hypothetical protein